MRRRRCVRRTERLAVGIRCCRADRVIEDLEVQQCLFEASARPGRCGSRRERGVDGQFRNRCRCLLGCVSRTSPKFWETGHTTRNQNDLLCDGCHVMSNVL
jgi:hypothetical protein